MTMAARSAKPFLRRHEACHQCRRKKMKCDGGCPCLPCAKAYRSERKRTSVHASIPPLQCSYDNPLDTAKRNVTPNLRNKIKRLENQVGELEELVRQIDSSSNHNQEDSSDAHSTAVRPTDFVPKPTNPICIANLPSGKPLHTLVEIFFNGHPHPRRMFHRQTFFKSLDLPTDHPDFPHPAILHAICAVVGMMTDDVPPPFRPNFADRPDDVLFPRRYQHRYNLPESFCEQQAHFAVAEMDRCESSEKHILDCLQAATILTCHYHSYAKLYDTYLLSGRAARISSLLGLNQCSAFDSQAPESTSKLVIEEESRLNSFWLMYAQERLFSTGSAWPMSIDDEDVMQLLPVPEKHFNEGVFVSPKERQWSNDIDVLTHHPPKLTDPFVLYIKSSLLVSKVKKFLIRQHALVLRASTGTEETPFEDLRETTEFLEVDALVETFIANFPTELTLSWSGDATEMHLFLAALVPHAAMILLHLPHADATSSHCPSATKIRKAASATMGLFRPGWTSSARNLMMSASFTMYAFFMTGKVVITFLEAASQGSKTNADEDWEETIEFIMVALGRIGERTPLARRYAKVLQNQLDSIGSSDREDI